MNPGSSALSPRRGASAGARTRLLALCILCSTLAFIAGCGSTPKRAALKRDAAAAATPTARNGGYYQDDGPGDNPPANLDQIEDPEPRIEPFHRFANNPYTVFGQQYVPRKTLGPYKERGIGSWYGRKFHGQRTSSGESYDMYGMSAAHATLPVPSYARVTNLANGRSAIVRINDRGPFHSGRLIDLSYTAAYKLGYAGAGSARVEVESITGEAMQMIAAQRRKAAPTALALVPAPAERQVSTGTAATTAIAAADPRETESAQPAQTMPLDAEAGGIYLQLGAFSGRDNAEIFRVRIYQQFAWLNDPIEILARDGMYRLHLGPYRDRFEAGGIADKLRESLRFKPVVVVR